MAKKILVAYNFNGNEVQNARMHNVAGDPGAPVAGQIWFDTSGNLMKWRNNAGVINPLARANHSGTQLAATISDFDTQVRTSRLDQMAAPIGAVAFNAQRLTGIGDGTGNNDAVSFQQLQAVVNGRTFKDAARVASTANIAAITGLLTIDGVVLVAGDRVLLKDQTTGSQNGIYVASAGAWARSTDADSATPDAELKAGVSLFVTEGTVNGDKQFTLTTNGPITVGSTAITFAVTGAGTTYTAGSGISIAGSVISVDGTVPRKFAQDVGDGASTSIAVTHGLTTLDVLVQVVEKSTGASVDCDIVRNSTSQVTLGFAVAPTAAQYRVVVQG